MNYSDLHTHTVFSDGQNTMEEMVRAAIRKNMISIGISDHSFTAFDRRYCMGEGQLAAYLGEICRVGAVYRDRIEVYAGLECDGYSEIENRAAFDYLIGDCHYIRTEDGYHSVDHAADEQRAVIDTYFRGDSMAYARRYYETYAERTLVQRPDILGHFDLVSKFGFVDEDAPAYRAMAAEALTACLAVTPIVEINTGAMLRKLRSHPYPAGFLLQELRARGGRVILSSDSHRADTLTGCFGTAVEVLRDAGFDSMMVFRGGQFEEVGLP